MSGEASSPVVVACGTKVMGRLAAAADEGRSAVGRAEVRPPGCRVCAAEVATVARWS